MQLTAAILLFAVSALASPAPQAPAANSSTTETSSRTSAAGAAASTQALAASNSSSNAAGSVPVWVVHVGSPNNDLTFSPSSIQAQPGDMVQFQFYSKNHSVASATFNAPCVPEQQSNPSAKNAFWSGFMPTEAEGRLVFTMQVRDTNPVYFYCGQAMHCQSGMVGAINAPPSGNTLDAFRQKAMQAPANVPPGGPAANGTASTAAPPPAAGSGQIGGATTAPAAGQGAASGTTTAAAAGATKNAAAVVESGRWRAGAGVLVTVVGLLFGGL